MTVVHCQRSTVIPWNFHLNSLPPSKRPSATKAASGWTVCRLSLPWPRVAGWIAIDPKGVIAPPEYEIGPLLINPWGNQQKNIATHRTANCDSLGAIGLYHAVPLPKINPARPSPSLRPQRPLLRFQLTSPPLFERSNSSDQNARRNRGRLPGWSTQGTAQNSRSRFRRDR